MTDSSAMLRNHVPCPDSSCGSSDGAAEYSSGWTHCFVCGGNFKTTTGEEAQRRVSAKPKAFEPVEGEYGALKARGITEETCRHWQYTKGTHHDKPVQVANYRDLSGTLVGQKLRYPDKTFSVRGKLAPLYGMWLWRDNGRKVVVTEGEIDALSVSQIQGNKWPVVSLSNGADGAEANFRKALEWLEGFDEVVLMFDQDEPGQKAVAAAAAVLSPGKAKVARLPLKDANEMLKAGREREVVDAIWGARAWRPDGIVDGAGLWDTIRALPTDPGLPYPWPGLTRMLGGLRPGELVTFTAGSGIGKTTAARHIIYSLLMAGETVGVLELESSVSRAALSMMSIHLGVPLHIRQDAVTEEQMRRAFDETMGTGRIHFYDHFGSMDPEVLLSKIRYMSKGLGCRWVLLDHLSIVMSGWETDDERRAIDMTMTKLRSLVEETQLGLILVSHLRRPSMGKGHEEGAQVSLSALRGSHSIAQLSDAVIALERDQQAEEGADFTTVRVLKNRHWRDTGVAATLRYGRETGRMEEVDRDMGFKDETESEAF